MINVIYLLFLYTLMILVIQNISHIINIINIIRYIHTYYVLLSKLGIIRVLVYMLNNHYTLIKYNINYNSCVCQLSAGGYISYFLDQNKGTWCSGITSASHAEGPGLKSQCVHACHDFVI